MAGIAEITEQELLDALKRAAGDAAGEDGATTVELADSLGWTKARVRGALKSLARAGRLEVVQARRVNLAGRVSSVPGYRLRNNGVTE